MGGEINQNPMPEIRLAGRPLEALGRFVTGLVRHLPENGYPSSHKPSGASELLDASLYDQVDIHGFLYMGEEDGKISE